MLTSLESINEKIAAEGNGQNSPPVKTRFLGSHPKLLDTPILISHCLATLNKSHLRY